MTSINVTGKLALVTGGSKGIGAAIAVALAENGARVAINYLSSQNEADALVKKHKNIALAVRADMSDPQQVESMVGKVLSELGSGNDSMTVQRLSE